MSGISASWACNTRHAMQITWFGHSCFRIDTGKSRILIDPFLTGNPTFEDSGHTVREVAKCVTHVALTHGHEDHTGNAVEICKETAAPLIAVYELAVHMASLGVAKIDLAFRAVKDDIARTEDGRLVARGESGELALKDYLTHFVTDNPELLPARIPGGSGAGNASRVPAQGAGIDLDKLRPGMSAEELDRIRQEISRVASQTLRGM